MKGSIFALVLGFFGLSILTLPSVGVADQSELAQGTEPAASARGYRECYENSEMSRAGYDRREMRNSSFFSNRELTKFGSRESGFPVANGATARYCYSRGCNAHITVRWTDSQIRYLEDLRSKITKAEDPQAELRFIRLAVVKMEEWLYRKIDRLSGAQDSANRSRAINRNGGRSENDPMAWVDKALASHGRFSKECVTYTMEATQHMMVLANLGLIKHWYVRKPYYDTPSLFNPTGHWTAALQNRQSCAVYRFDLNSRASAREAILARGESPLRSSSRNGLLPGMDRPSSPSYYRYSSRAQ